MTFVPWRPAAREADAIVAIGAAGSELEDSGVPILTVRDAVAPGAAAEDVRFTVDPQLDGRLHGIALAGQVLAAELEQAGDGEHVLAGSRSGAVWTRSRGGRVEHRVRAPLLELAPDAVLRDGIFGRGGLAVVALVQFLRELSRTGAFRPAPLRASIIFDDPNLRWRSYGFIDYRKVSSGTPTRHGYHAAMAMIPLDWWRPHRATAALFRRRSGSSYRSSSTATTTSSVSCCGSRDGLARAMALSAQALRRISRFEARYDLRVDRIMTAAPRNVLGVTWRARWVPSGSTPCARSIRCPWTETPPADRLLAGWDPAEFAGPCAVIPRFPLSCSATEIALRAFLDQPLVLYGHHDDLAQGLDPLAEAAARVNRLGDVEWTSVGSIALEQPRDPPGGRHRVGLPTVRRSDPAAAARAGPGARA